MISFENQNSNDGIHEFCFGFYTFDPIRFTEQSTNNLKMFANEQNQKLLTQKKVLFAFLLYMKILKAKMCSNIGMLDDSMIKTALICFNCLNNLILMTF